MEWKIGVIPRPPWRAEKASPQAFRTAFNAHMLRESNAASRALDVPPPAAPVRAQLAPVAHRAPPARKVDRAPPSPLHEEPLSEQAALRLSIMRKLEPFLDHWRACAAPACRRHRRCASGALQCQSQPAPRGSPKSEQAALANLKRALARRRAQLEGAVK